MMKDLLSKIDVKLLRRFGYYFVGLALGIIAVTYINKQKGTSFDYGPNARVLKQIRLKETLKISNQAQEKINKYQLDSLDIQYVLHKGDWNRSKSNVHQKPCPDYWIDATIGKKIDQKIVSHHFGFVFERCDSIATLKSINLIP